MNVPSLSQFKTRLPEILLVIFIISVAAFFRFWDIDGVPAGLHYDEAIDLNLGLRVLALSSVTNVCRPDEPHSTSGQEVKAVAESTEPKMRAIVFGLLSQLAPRD